MNNSARKFAHRSLLSLAIVLAVCAGMVGISGCHRGSSTVSAQENSTPDPSDANMAPVAEGQQAVQPPANAPVQSIENESQTSADQDRSQGVDQTPPPQAQSSANEPNDSNYENDVDAGQEALEQAPDAPPELPTYEQPEAPAPNYIWTPGYWGYAPIGFYWVPGAWVAAPYYGALWTPGYWGFYNNRYWFHHGYWGPYIGFYGGVNYGYGYFGTGYRGGYWSGNNFYYNRSVTRVNVTIIHNVYARPYTFSSHSRVAYNGGRGGIQVRPRPAEIAAMRQPRIPPMASQVRNRNEAAQNRQQFYKQNKGRPAIVAAPRPIPADKGIQRPSPRPENRPATQNRPSQQVRPAQPQPQPEQPYTRPNVPENRPNQPQVRPEAPYTRPNQPQVHPEAPYTRPNQPQVRPEQPYVRPEQPNARPNEPQPRPQQPQSRPNQEYRPQEPKPQQQTRPQPQPQHRAAPPEQHEEHHS